MSKQERVWHHHRTGGNPYVYVAPDGTRLAKSDTSLDHCHEGGDKPHRHGLRVDKMTTGEERYRAVRDDDPLFFS